MINFVLYNSIFDNIILIFLAINTALTHIVGWKEPHTKERTQNKNIIINTKITIFSIMLAILCLTTFLLFSTFVKFIVFFAIPSILLIKNIYETYTKNTKLSTDNKFSRLWSEYIFLLFFSSNTPAIYIKYFSNVNHTIKEITIIFYLLSKIILFIYLLLINIAIFTSNMFTLFPILIHQQEKIKRYYQIKDYDFLLFRKYRKKCFFIIDSLIYFILSLPTIIINFIYYIFLKFTVILKKINTWFILKIHNFNNNINTTIKKITNISIIIAFAIVYYILIDNKSLFTEIIIESYQFASTVLLIPFIYDYIKANKK
ncbi:MAG: hypothetical protein E7167_03745 [Firmicutes bacterium]|nr:hypothetical protein [Bacillota bacterium]